ncbi:hydroxymethylbilane synthase [Paeniglutamicibacter psychrophenolicus]|uniref:hydroxymethylbilane synthase n=1 Tax=Paeniglutamicibacter psychrophenolicus TaxID=257454 RepID=UPI002786F185|nr:hydroxymethylbilane synthase [Paeniglutamicibacter psychrophenolicus]MDQ0095454.1 hydroxymethylbilane synthase [Paeniglutamicibacter psychrophenolicus]
MSASRFTIGTRGSALATTQTGHVAVELNRLSGVETDTVLVKTEGDVTTGPLSQLGGTGVFAAALRQALYEGTCDLAVHSLKDLPTTQPAGLLIAATPKRADVRDALCARDGLFLAELPEGATVGTGSPRRSAQLLAFRPDLRIVDIRGNVGTRLGRVKGSPVQKDDGGVGRTAQGDLDAVVLAAAGLERLGLDAHITEYLDPDIMLPAPGQGSLAVEVRTGGSGHAAVDAALVQLDDIDTRLAVTAERALLARLEAGCAAPIGALATVRGDELVLDSVACKVDGSDTMRRSARTSTLTLDGAAALGVALAEQLLREGAAELAGL